VNCGIFNLVFQARHNSRLQKFTKVWISLFKSRAMCSSFGPGQRPVSVCDVAFKKVVDIGAQAKFPIEQHGDHN
jgi:hypothetical protein